MPSRAVLFFGASTLLLVVGLGAAAVRGSSREPIQVLLATPVPTGAPELKVYVTGAVRVPGVYVLMPGARAEDALRAAGGASEGADLERLNLAAKLKDGDHLLVPRMGETVPAGKVGVPRLNINTASQAALDTLPGIGATRAKRIVESRLQDGPFAEPFDLVQRKIVPLSLYQQIKDLVTVN